MAAATVTPAALDHATIAKDIGELKVGNGSARVVVGGATLAYLKRTRLAVRVAHVKRLPKKLGTAVPESNGVWANVAVKNTGAARAVLEYVARQQKTQKEAK
jgi:hypothetical protein